MKYQAEFRDAAYIQPLLQRIRARVTQPWTIMEVCGGQTHTIARYAIEDLLPDEITLIHGPGCPVCVTPLVQIERAIQLALQPNTLLCTFGDMMRVPGQTGDLFDARAKGADVRIITGALDALSVAQQNPERDVILFAVGFETTAPTTAMALKQADQLALDNFSVLAAHVRVPPALELILASPDCRVDGFLAAGHVCTVTGTREYPPIATRYGVPIVITGFEPIDILLGINAAITQLEAGRAELENSYPRAVRPEGNPIAKGIVDEVFEVTDQPWRGLGVLAEGGLSIRETFAQHDATKRFSCDPGEVAEPAECQAADILLGLIKPSQCPQFGIACQPEHPLGAPMVSTEGTCAAYFRYRQRAVQQSNQQ